jgi:hypothetical protein
MTMEMMTSGEVLTREEAGEVVLEVAGAVAQEVVGEVEQNPNLNPNHTPSQSPNPSLTPSLQQSLLAVESGAVEEEENGIAENHHPIPHPLPHPLPQPLPQPHLPSRAFASVTFSLINLVPIVSRVQEPAQIRIVLRSVAK